MHEGSENFGQKQSPQKRLSQMLADARTVSTSYERRGSAVLQLSRLMRFHALGTPPNEMTADEFALMKLIYGGRHGE